MRKNVTWNFHVDDLQENARYDMVIGQDLSLGIQIDLCLLHYNIMVNGGVYEGCNAYMRDMNNVYVRITASQFDDANFRDE